MKIVKFEDGTYGIRKGPPSNYQFADLRDNEYWWWYNIQYRLNLNRCNGTLEQAEKTYKRYIDTEKEIAEKLKDKGGAI